MNNSVREGRRSAIFRKLRSTCVEVEFSASFRLCRALKEDLIRVVEEARRYCARSTDTIVKLKTKIENSSTFESDPDFVKTLIQNCIDERVSRNEREVTFRKTEKLRARETTVSTVRKRSRTSKG
ncbi:hypothetical protein TNCV_3842711 [Trichonephila clavipes]|nr:hypothetical protein TNCV_3842711 [Trichonephila clavipes]